MEPFTQQLILSIIMFAPGVLILGILVVVGVLMVLEQGKTQ